ncbi:hypothetical protein M2650_12765 [Luteimonas sp. SX5]|uniref:PH domain-containing protein n=1 Tax=Luteimonas galliterrae TaxID=2940486 RepID=A0ABT0MMN7_9GAMM|nr:hypothetical protein [Luteimonas galliterrae]MCL1635494.1 hypothetical protein [Luteimonas galliterrae]
MHRTYVVGLRSYLAIGAAGCVFFTGCSIGAFVAKQYWPISVFAFFAVMSLYVLLSAGKYVLSDTHIAHQNMFGHFRMRWQDVRKVEFGTQGSIVLHGGEKRLVVAPPAYWSGSNKAEAFELLRSKLDKPDIKSYPSNLADYKIHKNVRV